MRLLLNKEDEGGGGVEEVEAAPVSTEADGGGTEQVVIPASTETPAESAVEAEPTEEGNDFNEFLDVKNIPEEKVEKKVETKVDEVKPTEVKPVAQPVKETLAQQQARKSRDYSGIPDKLKGSFERMSNEAFDNLKPLFLQAQKDQAELVTVKEQLSKIPKEGQLPTSYYEHPNAYVLSPEYAQASNNAQQAALVLEHWREQLDNVRSGSKEFQMLGTDPSTGKIIITGKQSVNEKSQSFLESMFFNSDRQANQFQQHLTNASSSHRARYQTAIVGLKNYENATFKALTDPNHPLQLQVKDAMNRIDPAFRDNPLLPVLAKALVSLTVVAQKYAAAVKNGGKATAAKPSKQSLAGPTASGSTAEALPKGNEVTMDDFEAVKNS